MERIQAFAEYGAILEETLDWLENGYRRPHEETHVIPPRPPRPPAHTVSEVEQPRAVESGEQHRTQQSSGDEAEPERTAQIDEIAAEIAVCRSCNLYLTRKNTVPGTGRPPVTLMIVTAPPVDNAAENESPLPPSESEYLGRWLTALQLNPETDCFVTPAVKCRTPGGRPPRSAESEACSIYLRRQYKALQPRAVLALGSAACAALTGSPNDFRSLVGKDWTWGSVPALVLWTPAEVLANPGRLRAPVWESLQRLKAAWNAFS